ncbi:MAG TPA: SpaA isopeptide-forming pilin-related protein [Gemmatimonas sp.]|nr:SpaA isopeptide-forming pilin-related protein [Gemmatimonas sp.]
MTSPSSDARRGFVALLSAVMLVSCSDNNEPTANVSAVDAQPAFAISVSSGNFQQCANGGAGGEPCVYINGVLNDSKSLYHESDVIAQRFVIPGLTVGHTYRLAFDYGWEKAVAPGHMNYDFIAGWNTTLAALANPCGNPLGNGGADIRAICNTQNALTATYIGTASMQVIPDAIFTTNAPLGLQAELQASLDRFQTVRGASAVRMDIIGGDFPGAAFDNVTYRVNGDDVNARFTVRFIATRTTVMLLWGGHFADNRDFSASIWDHDKNAGTAEGSGSLTGAAGQSGAPFHFTQQYIKNITTGDSTGIGSLSNNVQGSVLEPIPKASIAIAASATNGIGEPHTFTVTLRKDLDNGAGSVAAAGEHVNVTLSPTNGAVVQVDAAASTCDDAGANTNASGQCTIVFTSNAAGTVTGSASATLSLGGTSATVSTDGSGDNSPAAVKLFVAGSLLWLKHDGRGALLGGAVFTVCRTHLWDSDLNGGAGGYADITPDICSDVSDNVSGTNNTSASPADRDGTSGKFELGGLILGRYTVTEKTPPVGYALDGDTETVNLSTTVTSFTVATAFVNVAPTASITIAEAATNGIGESHTFTVTLRKDLDNGAGSVAAAGEHVDVTLTPAGDAVVTLNSVSSTCDDAGPNTNASGQCTVVFTSTTAGTITGSASATLSLNGVSVTATTNGSGQNSAPAVKAFVAGSLRWFKHNGTGQLLGGAVFTVCRTERWDSDLGEDGGYVDIDPDVCFDVSDNASGTNNTNAPPADWDGTGGEFQLSGLVLGKYTVKEKTAPAGYILDADTESASLSTTSPSATIKTIFVNLNPDAFITISTTATNNTTEPHTFTAKMTAVPNGGSPVSIADFIITVSPVPSTLGAMSCDAFDATTNSKTCRRSINSNVAGAFTANASATAVIAGISIVRATNGDHGVGGSNAAVKTYVAPGLAITKTPDLATDAGGTVQVGGTASFTITVSNSNAAGTGTALGVVMTDTLPAGLTWTDNKSECAMDQVTVSMVSRSRITCTIGDLAKGQSFAVTVTSSIIPSSFIMLPPSATTDAIEVQGDGNLDDDLGKPGKDWKTLPLSVFNCALNVGCRTDTPSGSADSSFGEGSKEDTPVPAIVDGGIPPNKSDLRRFYVAQERVGSQDYVYLGWTRVQDPSGTTNMDFELNQSRLTSTNLVTPVRTAGDILVRFDLSNGGTNPQLSYHKWITTGSKSQCEAANAVPCWGKQQTLSNDVVASINTGPITDVDGSTLSARTFGEASINLANFFTGGGCQSFGQAYLKSRSSDAFGSAMKDYIAPIPVNITTCRPVDMTNTAFASASNFAPTGGNLGDPISDTGSIRVTGNGSASLNPTPALLKGMWAVVPRRYMWAV